MTFHALNLTVHGPTTLSLEERLEVAQLGADCFSFAFPEDPPQVVESGAEELLHRSEDEETLLVLARLDGRLVGQARLEYALSQNTDRVHAGVLVHPAYRRRGVGRALAGRAAELALERGRVGYTSATSSRSPQGERFAHILGAQAALPMVISELRVPGTDPAMLAGWVTRPQADAYALHRFAHIPEHELARVAAVMDVMNTAPRGDLDFEDWTTTPAMIRSRQESMAATGYQGLLYATEHLESGVFVGFSELHWHSQRALLVYQGGTGTHPEHRAQGLGKWLKAQMLLDLPAHNPQAQRIRTGNADSNAAMLGINRALGFEPAFRRTEWQGRTAEVTNRREAERQHPVTNAD
ncbi:GNAT family N-acetyltransferase [Deinococcus sp. UYEF24]